MRFTTLGMSALALAAISAPAFAEDAPASPFTVTGGATLVTDYRFRGVSQTNKEFAVQGTLSISHSSGFYATVWGSSIDDYVAGGSDQEIDLIAGYTKTISGFTLDGGVLYYYYPGSSGIIPNYNSDFFEPYASVKYAYGPVTGKVGIAYAPKQSALSIGAGKEDNIYAYGELSGAIGPIALTSHVGYSGGRSYLTAGLKGYWDWNIGASYTWNHLTLGVQYVDTDLKSHEVNSFTGKDIGKAGVVGSIGVAF